MAVIGHDHETIQSEWVEFLYPVERVDCLQRICRIAENFPAALYVGGDEHRTVGLEMVMVKHTKRLPTGRLQVLPFTMRKNDIGIFLG